MQPHYRLIVAAVGTACGLAQAQAPAPPQSVVEIYGTIVPFFENVKTTGATSTAPPAAERPSQLSAAAYTGVNDPARNRLSVGTTNLGFRGYEQLGGDLRLVWQLESGFQIDQNTGPGLGARDSKVGLRNRWGEVFLGQWDTPYKYISLPVNPLRAGYVFDRTAITGNPGMGVPNTTTQFTRIGAKPDASFDRRQGNSVQYWSPNLGGFTFRVGHSVNEGKGPVTATGPIVSPTVTAASAQYDRGGLSLRYAYEQHNDYFGMSQIGGSAAGTATNPSSKDRGHKFVFLWRIGNTRLTGLVEQLDYRNDESLAGAVSKYKRTAAYGVIEQFFANNSSVWVSYGRASDGSCERVGGVACSTHALGAQYLTTGYIYRFSKRTEVYVAYYKMMNKENGTYSPGPIVGASLAPGADTIGAGVGMIHFF
jgi:predicted porin